MTAKELTSKYGQEQLLKYWDTLDSKQQEALEKDIESIDFELMNSLYEAAGKPVTQSDLGELSPIPLADVATMGEQEKHRLYRKGMEILLKGKMAALTMAGGQGSRLGHDGPKGTYDIGLPTHKSLFEIQCDGLKKMSIKQVVWCLGTL